jgi:hypothetical protein
MRGCGSRPAAPTAASPSQPRIGPLETAHAPSTPTRMPPLERASRSQLEDLL